MKRFALPILFALVLGAGLWAEGPAVEEPAASRVGLETNVLWPFIPGVGIYSAKATLPLWSAGELEGELTLGFLYRPPLFRDTEGTFSELGLNLGYRQFLWKGLNVELALWPSRATLLDNVVDGRDYVSWGLTTELYAGWRFDFAGPGGLDFYILPQVGAGMTAFTSDPWPIQGGEDGPFFVGNLILGLRLP